MSITACPASSRPGITASKYGHFTVDPNLILVGHNTSEYGHFTVDLTLILVGYITF